MKKISSVFLSIIMSLCLHFYVNGSDVYGYSDDTCDTTLEIVSEDEFLINYSSSLSLRYKMTDFTAYKIVYIDKVISSYLISDGVIIIIPQSLSGDTFVANIVINDFEKLAVANINSYILNLLISDYAEIEFGSDISSPLLELTSRFEMMYYNSDSTEEIPSFQPFTFERNYKTIEQMTSTDSFLDGYKPDFFVYSDTVKFTHDPIINLIPENWFYQTGTRCYVGEEYAVYVRTSYVANHVYTGLMTYTTDVSIYDIEISLPCYTKTPNSAYPNLFTNSKDYIFTVEPVVQASYYAYEKNNMGDYTWGSKFDTSEDRIVVIRYDSKPNIFIAPTYNATQIDYGNDIEYLEYGKNSFGIAKYSYNFESSLPPGYISSIILEGNLVGLGFDTFAQIMKFFPQTQKFAFIPKLAGKYFKSLYEDKIKDELEKEFTINKENDFIFDFGGKLEKTVPGTSITYTPHPYFSSLKYPDFTNIFNSQVIGHHKHTITISLGQRNAPAPDDFFAIHNYLQFEFYSKAGKIMTKNSDGSSIELSASYMYSHENMVFYTNENPIQFSAASSNDVYINGADPAKNICFRATNTTMSRLLITPNGATNGCEIKIYDQEGKLIKKVDTYNSDQKQLLLNVTSGNFYMFVVSYKNKKSGYLFFSFGVPLYREVPYAPFYIYWSSALIKFDMYKLSFQYTGTYFIKADTNNDTTIRLYNKSGHLIYESFDPHYDPYEDVPVLYAQVHLKVRYGDPYEFYLEVDTENSGPPNYTRIAPVT